MNLADNGATNGAPDENNGISCVIVSGDFLEGLLEGNKEITSGSITGVSDEEKTLIIGLKTDTDLDIAFREMCEKDPNISAMELTPEEWDAKLRDYVAKRNVTLDDKDI